MQNGRPPGFAKGLLSSIFCKSQIMCRYLLRNLVAKRSRWKEQTRPKVPFIFLHFFLDVRPVFPVSLPPVLAFNHMSLRWRFPLSTYLRPFELSHLSLARGSTLPFHPFQLRLHINRNLDSNSSRVPPIISTMSVLFRRCHLGDIQEK